MKTYIVNKKVFNHMYESIKGMVFYKNIDNDTDNVHVKFGCNKYKDMAKTYFKTSFESIFIETK